MGDLTYDLKTDPPCHARTCAIQTCLQKNNFKQERCEHLIDQLYECCNAFYEKEGWDASCVSCSKPDLLKLKMKQRSEGK